MAQIWLQSRKECWRGQRVGSLTVTGGGSADGKARGKGPERLLTTAARKDFSLAFIPTTNYLHLNSSECAEHPTIYDSHLAVNRH